MFVFFSSLPSISSNTIRAQPGLYRQTALDVRRTAFHDPFHYASCAQGFTAVHGLNTAPHRTWRVRILLAAVPSIFLAAVPQSRQWDAPSRNPVLVVFCFIKGYALPAAAVYEQQTNTHRSYLGSAYVVPYNRRNCRRSRLLKDFQLR